jgi:hypothetical protein
MNHFYFNIPGWFAFHDVYDRAVALLGRDGAHFVEVGCWEGRSAAYMGVNIVNSGKKIQFDCVDTWEDPAVHWDLDLAHLTMAAGSPVIVGEDIYSKFKRNMGIFSGFADVRAVRMKSVDAASQYEDGSLDFVFLDASYEMQDVYNDIEAWTPKLRTGRGVLAGDDADYIGVRMALLKHGMGTPTNPLVMSAGAHKSWAYTPFHVRNDWTTKTPPTLDPASHQGTTEAALEHMQQLLKVTPHEL